MLVSDTPAVHGGCWGVLDLQIKALPFVIPFLCSSRVTGSDWALLKLASTLTRRCLFPPLPGEGFHFEAFLSPDPSLLEEAFPSFLPLTAGIQQHSTSRMETRFCSTSAGGDRAAFTGCCPVWG